MRIYIHISNKCEFISMNIKIKNINFTAEARISVKKNSQKRILNLLKHMTDIGTFNIIFLKRDF